MRAGASQTKHKHKNQENKKTTKQKKSHSKQDENSAKFDIAIKKASSLADRGEIEESLDLFVKIISRKFKIYMAKVHEDDTENKKQNISNEITSK